MNLIKKNEKTLIKTQKFDKNQSKNPSLDSGLAVNLNIHQKQV
jgi:hypothetical protein